MTVNNPLHVRPPGPFVPPGPQARPGVAVVSHRLPAPDPRTVAEFPTSAQALPGPFLREYRPSWPYRHRSAQCVAVLYYRSRPPRSVGPEGDESFLLRWLTRPYTAFELQLGWHTVSFQAQLPAAESGRSFPAEVAVRWRVADPFEVARSQVTDVGELLVPELVQRLRDVSRAYSIHYAEEVRDAVNAALDGHAFGASFGLELDVFVTIQADRLIREHGTRVGEVLNQTDVERFRQRLREIQDDNQRLLIERWAESFQRAVEKGDDAVMAQMMARNPKDIQEIRKMFHGERREERQDGMELMTRLIDGGLLERWELGEQAMVVVEFLRSGARRVASHPLPELTEPQRPKRALYWERESERRGPGPATAGPEGESAGTGEGTGQGDRT
ncbi:MULTISPECIES: hypothetical protein [unclassified Streptomyces]|uniref:hypothetical protein n=1 Tax=unclassified Streptomyces TaxID=2593676 RepID=UPI00070114B8|nr:MULTISPECIES: hypothetical protein [unclassified Streptomyces]KQX56298.1 hypothetical protein ASD33_30105 [Streptomyces sp. Root1304]KRA97113.1 hypothetical protein ASE09_26915 [Streptomyces sp. Root66D1]